MNIRLGCSGSNGQVPHPLKKAYHITAEIVAVHSVHDTTLWALIRADFADFAWMREASGTVNGRVRKRKIEIGVAIICSAGTNGGILPVWSIEIEIRYRELDGDGG
jgi:hypothetical protein